MKNKLTMSLIILNVVVFELVFSMPSNGIEWVFRSFSFSYAARFEVWRWLTSLFLHISASHLFFNMLGIYFFGRALEEQVPGQWFMAIYFISGLLGNFVYMFTSQIPVIGASGAMFGLMGAAMFLNPIKKIYVYIFPLPLGIVSVIIIFFETWMTYFKPEIAAINNIANIAHIGGLITGGIFSFFHDPKRAGKGILILTISVFLLLLLVPLFALITGIGGLILIVIEKVVGFFLYGIAGLIGVVWG